MSKAPPELVVISRLYDLVLWTSLHAAKFPRIHKFTVGDRLTNRIQDVLERLIAARYTRERRELLTKANLVFSPRHG